MSSVASVINRSRSPASFAGQADGEKFQALVRQLAHLLEVLAAVTGIEGSGKRACRSRKELFEVHRNTCLQKTNGPPLEAFWQRAAGRVVLIAN